MAKRIESETYLTHLCRFIHANPVKDELVDSVDDWRYSNFLKWIGQRDGLLFNQEFVKDHFPNPGDYISFINDFIETRRLPDETMGYLDEFEKWLSIKTSEVSKTSEVWVIESGFYCETDGVSITLDVWLRG